MTQAEGFGARFHAAIADRGPFCVGIDPHAGLLHDWGLERRRRRARDVRALRRRGRRPALRGGEAAVGVLRALRLARRGGARAGDRGVACRRCPGAARREARRHRLDLAGLRRRLPRPGQPARLRRVTVSPFLGFGSLDPFVDTARKHDAGLFVLALTSNKEGPEVQHATTDTGETVASRMLDHLRRLNADAEPLGSFGAVVGATIGPTPVRTSPSTARSSRRASAPRAARRPTSPGSSGRPRPT